MVVPPAAHPEAALVGRDRTGVARLDELVAVLRGELPWPDPPPSRRPARPAPSPTSPTSAVKPSLA